MLVSSQIGQVASSYVPGLGEEVYDTRSGAAYRGDSYTPISGLTPVGNASSGSIPELFPFDGSILGYTESVANDRYKIQTLTPYTIPPFREFSLRLYMTSVNSGDPEDENPDANATFSVYAVFYNMGDFIYTGTTYDPDGGELNVQIITENEDLPLGYLETDAVQSDVDVSGTVVVPETSWDFARLYVVRAAVDDHAGRNVLLRGLKLINA